MRINEAGILLLTYADLQECGFEYHAVRKAKARGVITGTRAHNGREAELEYESLPDKYKMAVLAKYGNPYVAAANESLLAEYLVPDVKAISYYEKYRYEGGERLDAETFARCNIASTWMGLATALKHKMPRIPRDVHKKLTANQWELFFAVLAKQANEVKIPHVYTRLTRKVDEYYNKANNEYNYEALIPKYKGQSNAAKVATEEQQALLKFLLGQPQNLPDTIVANEYNHVAKQKGWKTISENTVRNHRLTNAYLLSGLRKGKSEYLHKTRGQAKRTKPKKAGMVWATDGFTCELHFQHHKRVDGKLKRNYQARLEIMAVFDPFNNFCIGYSVGKENVEAIKEAIKNAVDRVYSVTGKYYLINELIKDKFGNGALEPWSKQATVYHRHRKVGNSKDNPAERIIESLNEHYFIHNINWSGRNITSKRQRNFDVMDLNQHNNPTIDEGFMQIAKTIEDYNKDKQAEWEASIKEMASEGMLHEIDRYRYLELFGTQAKDTIKAYAAGLFIQIKNKQMHYDLLDIGFREQIRHTDWIVKYDKRDTRTILVISKQNGSSYMLTDKNLVAIPLAQMEMTNLDKANVNALLQYNRTHEKKLETQLDEIFSIVDDLEPEFDKIHAQKTKNIYRGSQKKALQEAKDVVDVEAEKQPEVQQSYPPAAKVVDWINYGANKGLIDV